MTNFISFNSIIENTFRDQSLWNIYKSETLPKINIFTPEGCRDFINSFLKVSKKREENFQLEVLKHLKDDRVQHIVSVYFLGLGIYNTNDYIKRLIDNEFQEYKRKEEVEKAFDDTMNFAYIWFLISLFHDLGYPIENGDLPFDIDYILKYGLNKLKKISFVPDFYSLELGLNYDNYIKDNFHPHDHGVCGGIKMYDSLCYIRHSSCDEEKDAIEKELWKPELDKIFKFVSWIVFCHNMFFMDRNDTQGTSTYDKYNLKELIKEPGEYKIKFQDYPLFVFFVLIDSIEPVKKTKDFKLLDYILLQSKGDKIIIESILDTEKIHSYSDYINRLNSWFTRVTSEDGYIILHLCS